MNRIWELPDEVLFRVLCYTACPTHRASILCHQLAPLCRQSNEFVQTRDTIWESILLNDYGIAGPTIGDTKHPRSSKRLKKSTICRVKEAHKLVKDNTEIAYFFLSEMASNQGSNKLTRGKFLGLLREYGPHLRYNQTLSSGGIFLVEICRAKHVREHVVLQCVQELVERRGALVNASSYESPNNRLTALTVAAARGMAKVVRYLVDAGADPTLPSSGRFQLHSNPRKSITLRNMPAIAFSQAMLEEEISVNPDATVTSLRRCVAILGAER